MNLNNIIRKGFSSAAKSVNSWAKSHAGYRTFFDKLFGGLSARFLGTNLTGAERESNAFTAQQNSEAMAFEERLANKQMDFQAEQAATQWQRGVQDMQAAGLNPALAYGQGGASAMSGSSGAGHAGASVAPGALSSLSELIQLATLKPTIENMQAEAQNRRAEARLKEIDADTRGEMNVETINQLRAVTESAIQSGKLSKYQRTVLAPLDAAIKRVEKESAEYKKTSDYVQSLRDAWEKEFYDKNHYWPGVNAQQAFFRWVQGIIHNPRENAPFQITLPSGETKGMSFPLN